MNHLENYDNYSASDYYDAVTLVSDRASEALYYLLKHRLSRALCRLYDLYGFGLEDHFDDTIDDFFLYLYDYDVERPFAIFETIREKEAFFGWTVGAYRNFLINKSREEVKRRKMMEGMPVAVGEDEHHLTDENLMCFIAKAIAYADQELKPHHRFILYRFLLTILNQKLALPQEAVAHVIGMHPVTYRVCVNRLRTRLSDYVSHMEKGRNLPLDSKHLLMSERLLRGFDHLYDLLMPYYEETLQVLPMALEINELRASYGRDGILMHESSDYSYPHVVDVRELYESLKS